MAEPLKVVDLIGLSADQSEVCSIEASCVTGFEPMAIEELKEVLGIDGIEHRGRILFDIPVSRVKETLGLRVVNNLWVLVAHTHKFDYPESCEEQLTSLADYAASLDWTKALDVWRNVFDFKGTVFPQKDGDGEDIAKKPKLDAPSFRCTCYRSGKTQKFKSVEGAIAVGGRIQDLFNWNVKMKDYDMEVVINCDVDQVYVGVALNNSSLFNRTITHLGLTSLRPTISAGLVRLAKVLPGDVVLDPMCGGGSIPIEGSLVHKHGFYLGGDNHDLAAARTRDNIKDLKAKNQLTQDSNVDCMQWSALHPCLRDNCVDVVISDLPFGKRSGSKANNVVLYPEALIALARIVRPTTGRAVLLTQDKNSMFKTIPKVAKYWKVNRYLGANIGGLTALIFLLKRTGASPLPPSPLETGDS